MMKKLIFTLSLLLLVSCSKNPVTGERELTLISEDREISMGSERYGVMQQASGGEYLRDRTLSAYVERVGNKIAGVSDRPYLPYEFVVLNSSIPNAWALPGGKIGVNRGLLIELESEAELAAVLAHEIVHAAARHGVQNVQWGGMAKGGLAGFSVVTDQMEGGDLILGASGLGVAMAAMKYSRDDELEADEYGMLYMVRAGYDPQGMISLQEKLMKMQRSGNRSWVDGLFASHPPSQERVQACQKNVQLYPEGGYSGESEYETAIADLKAHRHAYSQLDEAEKALGRGDVKGALQMAHKGIEFLPDEAHFYSIRGRAKFALGDFQGAVDDLTEALGHNRNFFDFYLQRGRAYDKLQQREQAKSDLTKSSEMFPTVSAFYLLGQIAMGEGRNETAIQHFRIASRGEGRDAREAERLLVTLNLEYHPEEYIKVCPEITPRGEVILAVTNCSPISLRNFQFFVEVERCDGVIEPGEPITVYRRILPGQTLKVATNLGPYPMPRLPRELVECGEGSEERRKMGKGWRKLQEKLQRRWERSQPTVVTHVRGAEVAR